MDFMEWNSADVAIKLHVAAAMTGLVLGAVVLLRRKGGTWHRLLGRCFAAAALLTATSSFFIHEIQLWGIWSPIHLLSIYVIAAVFHAVNAARQGRIRAHKRGMVMLYVSGFIVAGGFTLLPERLIFQTLLRPSFAALFPDDRALGETVALGLPLAASVAGAIILWRVLVKKKPRPLEPGVTSKLQKELSAPGSGLGTAVCVRTLDC